MFLIRALVLLAVAFAIGMSACSEPAKVGNANEGKTMPSMEIQILSRGRGVPESTRTVFQSMIGVLEDSRESGEVVDMQRKVVGLEGETQLCVVFRDEKAFTEMEKRLQKMGKGVDLLQIRNSPCD